MENPKGTGGKKFQKGQSGNPGGGQMGCDLRSPTLNTASSRLN
jgi:hypothetical protein